MARVECYVIFQIGKQRLSTTPNYSDSDDNRRQQTTTTKYQSGRSQEAEHLKLYQTIEMIGMNEAKLCKKFIFEQYN